MKNNLQIVALSVALFSPSLNAASLASGDVLITVTSSGGTAATSDNSANAYVGVSADLINNKGDVGDASASGNALTIINDSGGFTADLVLTPATAAAVVRDQNAGNPVADASASVSYSATFTLAPTESGVFSLDLNYSLTEGGAEAFFTWSLSGPSGSISAINGAAGSATAGSETLLNQQSNQSVVLNEAGSYTLTVSADVAAASIASIDSSSVSINALQFAFVPEPSTMLLVSIGGLALFRRRRG